LRFGAAAPLSEKRVYAANLASDNIFHNTVEKSAELVPNYAGIQEFTNSSTDENAHIGKEQ